MNDLENQLPRIFQCNLHRFYQRVIAPVLENLPEPVLQEVVATNSMNDNLDLAAAQVNAHTHNEATKAFVLALAGLFERQLRHWALHLFSPPDPRTIQEGDFTKLWTDALKHERLMVAETTYERSWTEAFLVANVVRHGDGRTSRSLREIAPELWAYDPSEYVDINAGPSPDSEQIRIRSRDIQRYVHAGVRFWGRVDLLPMAETEPPF
jgi:hypothetical protein